MRKNVEKKFEMVDPFNPQNTVKGIVYQDNERYGDLLIQFINDKRFDQYIYTTPKFYYPGKVTSPRKYNGKNGFPEDYVFVNIYDKLDGTNICLFKYYDIEGNTFISYKTRRTPFLKSDSKWGNFLQYWKRTSEDYKEQLQSLIDSYPAFHFGFEMYGSVNPILIEYKVPLKHKLLYAINRTNGKLIDPDQFDYPTPTLIKHISSVKKYDLDNEWKELQTKYKEQFLKDKSVEGCMFYINNKEGYSTVYKCKPLEVLNEQGDKKVRLSWKLIYNTAKNGLEEIDELSELLNITISLLLEEFSELEINEHKGKIEQVVKQVINEIHFEAEVMELYHKLGIEFTKENKGKVMRTIIKEFPENNRKYLSTKIYNILAKIFFLDGE